ESYERFCRLWRDAAAIGLVVTYGIVERSLEGETDLRLFTVPLAGSLLVTRLMAFSTCFGAKKSTPDEADATTVESLEEGVSTQPPKSQGKVVDWKLKAMFCVIGCVALLGWNFILGELGTLIDAFGDAYGTWCSLCYSLCINAGQLMLVWIGNRFKFGPRFYTGCFTMG
ncbi:solute carrier 29 (nucleoside transporters), member, partial [Perkinsus olseni]